MHRPSGPRQPRSIQATKTFLFFTLHMNCPNNLVLRCAFKVGAVVLSLAAPSYYFNFLLIFVSAVDTFFFIRDPFTKILDIHNLLI